MALLLTFVTSINHTKERQLLPFLTNTGLCCAFPSLLSVPSSPSLYLNWNLDGAVHSTVLKQEWFNTIINRLHGLSMTHIYFTPKASTALLNALGFPGALHPWADLVAALNPNSQQPSFPSPCTDRASCISFTDFRNYWMKRPGRTTHPPPNPGPRHEARFWPQTRASNRAFCSALTWLGFCHALVSTRIRV